jgi:DNA-binding NarL/FixJ family response regulator
MLVGRLARLEERHDIVSRDGLTRREHEIAALIGEGLSNKEIARRLRIQNPTVKNHIHSILGKLQLRRRGQVAAHLHRNPQA